MRRHSALLSELGTFFAVRSWADCIINMSGFDLRQAQGKYLILPPGYDGPLPEGGFYITRSRTTRVLLLGRSFM